MARYRIKAYFMHDDERLVAETAAKDTIRDAELTASYVMGIVEESEIKRLQKKGLAVSIVEEVATNESTRTLPQDFTNFSTAKHGLASYLPQVTPNLKAESKIVSKSARRSFYVVRLHGPVTEARAEELRSLKIELRERLSRNRYVCELLPSQVDKLATLKFVNFIRKYGEEDTLQISSGLVRDEQARPDDIPKRLRISRTGKSRAVGIYSVRLHKKDDLKKVVRWVKSKGGKVLWARAGKFQATLLENGRVLKDLASRQEVALIEQVIANASFDQNAREILGLVRDSVDLGLDGEGEIVGIADTGIDSSHPDLKRRIIGSSAWGRNNETSDPDGHGTHVAGCLAGDGAASKGEIQGSAPGAKLFVQSLVDSYGTLGGLPDDLGRLFAEAYKRGVRIHNNSWGAFTFAAYSKTTLEVDQFVAKHQDMLVVMAAGNDGIAGPRVKGGAVNAATGFVDWASVASPATAKNGLTVGASRSSRTRGGLSELTWNDAWPHKYPDPPISAERISSDCECLAAFSSRGPCDDYRIKPDVVAPGTDIAAARSADAPLYHFWGAYPKNKMYAFMGGTSMAAPYVSGCAAIVRQWLRTIAGWSTPSAALIKATLINGARRLSGDDAVAALEGEPNFHQGFGIIDMRTTIPNPLMKELRFRFDDTWKNKSRFLNETGDRIDYQVDVSDELPLRICLAWTDPPGRAIQNSLVLMVEDPSGNKWFGNKDVAATMKISGATRDPSNNVQIVRFFPARAGTYRIAISASMLIKRRQAFAIVVSGALLSTLDRVK